MVKDVGDVLCRRIRCVVEQQMGEQEVPEQRRRALGDLMVGRQPDAVGKMQVQIEDFAGHCVRMEVRLQQADAERWCRDRLPGRDDENDFVQIALLYTHLLSARPDFFFAAGSSSSR